MKIIKHSNLYWVMLIALMFSSITLFARNEIEITTSSKKALQIFKEARMNLENLEFQTASDKLDKAIAIDSDFAMAHLLRYQTGVDGYNVTKKHLDKAVSLIDNVSEGEKSLIRLGKAYNENNQTKQKIYVNRLISTYASDKRVHTIAGNYFFGIQDYETAKKHLKKAIRIDESHAPAYNMLGYTESSLENYSSAKEAFQTYIKLIPDNPNPYDSYAELMLKLGNYDESIEYYEKAYSKDNSFLVALLGLGHNYVFKGDFEKARKNYTKAKNDSKDISTKLGAQYWIATSYVHEGNTDMAVKAVEEQRKMAKDRDLVTNVINSYNLEGFILTESGNAKEGMKKYNMAAELVKTSDLDNDLKDYYTLMAGINRCYSLTANDMISDAEEEAKMCSKMVNERNNPSEIRFLHGNLARLEMKKGNYKKAIEHFTKSNMNSPYNWHYLAVAYEKVGNNKKADEYNMKVKNSNNANVGRALVTTKSTE